MAPFFGLLAWHHDLVSFAGADLVVTTGAPVGLLRLVGLHVTNVDAVVGFGPAVRAHAPVTVPPRGDVSVLESAQRE